MTELLESFNSAYELYTVFTEQADRLIRAGTDPSVVASMRKNTEESTMKFFADKVSANGICAVTLQDREYPDLLREISDPPAVLFYRGDISAASRGLCVSMVGSRNASWKGLTATEKIARELSLSGISIVSGLADGIDSAAHKGCIAGKSPTVAVMGCGLDRVYPVTNSDLAKRILDSDGLLLSEFAPGEKPLGWHFPIRNRIISGMSRATLMMECRIRSGSMTTVRHALEQGREVYAYPGDTNSPWAEGSHQLLREGAVYFTSASDVIEDLADLGYLDKSQCCVQNNVCQPVQTELTPAQRRITDAMKDGAASFDELSAATGLSSQELFSALTVLMIKGIVRACPGKTYELQ